MFSCLELYLKLSLFQHIRMAFLACLVLPVALMMIDLTVLSWEQVDSPFVRHMHID